LAPINGAVCNGLPRCWVLVGAAGFCLASLLLFGAAGGPWLACLIFLALGSAVFSPTRYAMLPAVAQETRIPLGLVNSWIEMGGAGGIVAGLALGLLLHGMALQGAPWVWSSLLAGWLPGSWPAAVGVSAGLSVLSLLAALAVRFPSDARRP